MNLNLPGSISQHIHRDTIFSQREIVINIPTVDTNESNGATLVFDGSGKEPLSYLNFLLKRNEFEEAIVCTNKGDAFVRDSNMFHAGRTNHTNFIRPMFAISIRKKEPHIRYANYQNYNVIEDNEFKISYNWYKNNGFSFFMERVYYLIPFLKDLRRIIMSIVRNKDFPT